MFTESLLKRLDPGFKAFLEATKVPAAPGHQPSLEELRTGYAQIMSPYAGAVDPRLEVQDLTLEYGEHPPVEARLFRPAGRQGSAGDGASASQPVCVFAHGGGWVLGDLDTHAGICSDLAMSANCAVLALHYRRSPEHCFPAAMNDCETALRWVQESGAGIGLDAQRCVFCGDSAGASLASAAALNLRGSNAVPGALILIYPALGADMSLPSYAENEAVPGLTSADMEFFFTSYIGGYDLPDPLAAPMTVAELSGLPPVYTTVAELDPLRDDGVEFHRRLLEAGVKSELSIEPGLGHSWLWPRHSSAAAGVAFSRVIDYLSASLGSASPGSSAPGSGLSGSATGSGPV